MFYGSGFLFDDKSSLDYDLRILNFETGGLRDSPAGSESTIYQKWIYRKSKAYFYGRSQNIPLEFDLTIGSESAISGDMRNIIEDWLLGKNEYLPLQIAQDDIDGVIFNVIFTKSSAKYVGNLNYAFTLHAECDAPWGFSYPQTLVKSYPPDEIANETFDFYNESADSDYLYPELSFTTSGVGTSFALTNLTDDSTRIFSFTGISAGETITIDCDKQIIASSTGLLRMPNFSRKFFRLLQKNNSLNIVGGITEFTMTYSFAKKVGG